jgi:hypothetical protein
MEWRGGAGELRRGDFTVLRPLVFRQLVRPVVTQSPLTGSGRGILARPPPPKPRPVAYAAAR